MAPPVKILSDAHTRSLLNRNNVLLRRPDSKYLDKNALLRFQVRTYSVLIFVDCAGSGCSGTKHLAFALEVDGVRKLCVCDIVVRKASGITALRRVLLLQNEP